MAGGILKNGHSHLGASFGVSKGVVVVVEGDAEELAQIWERVTSAEIARYGTACCGERAVKRVIRIIHAVAAEGGFYAPLVEGFVVGHQREDSYHLFKPAPHDVEGGGVLCHFAADAVDVFREMTEIIFRLRFDKLVEAFGDDAVDDFYRADCAYAGGVIVGRLHVNGHEVVHRCLRLVLSLLRGL